MSVCHLHPDQPALSDCEYCLQPHCSACLQVFLGRRYCPSCLARVTGLAGRSAEPVRPPGAPVPGMRTPLPGPPTQPRVPGWVSAGAYLLLFLLLQLAAQTIHVVGLMLLHWLRRPGSVPPPINVKLLMDPAGPSVPLWVLAWFVFGWLTLGATLLLTGVFLRHIERKGLEDIGLRWPTTFWRDLPLGLSLAAALFLSMVGIGLSRDAYFVRELAGPMQALFTVVLGFGILLPLAAVEEISTRGYLMLTLGRSWGRWPAALLSCAVFALLHGANPAIGDHPLAMAGLVAAGFYLVSAYLITDNLWLPIFLHTGWNLMEGPVFGLPVSGMPVPFAVLRIGDSGPALWTGGSFGPEAGLLLLILMVAHIGTLWALRPLLQRRRTGSGESEESGAAGPATAPA